MKGQLQGGVEEEEKDDKEDGVLVVGGSVGIMMEL
jgi:hypothetical protein